MSHFLFRYTEARKDREKFRKRLVEVIMHRDEWDDEDAEPGKTVLRLFGKPAAFCSLIFGLINSKQFSDLKISMNFRSNSVKFFH